MDLLTIKHTDFELTIECSNFFEIWNKAQRNVGSENLLSSYTWTEGVISVVRYVSDGTEQLIKCGNPAPAVFFENVDYPIWVEFCEGVNNAQFGSILQSDNSHFSFRKKRRILSGFINYLNDIGRSEINICYNLHGIQKIFTFSFEVFSTKLNYREHWKSMVEEIESEYCMLSLDYMRRTFHGFSPTCEGERSELIWWSIFSSEQKKFIRAVKTIIERPKHRLCGISSYSKADKLKRINRQIEEEYSEHKHEYSHLYHFLETASTNDTLENRFLKYATSEITQKYERLKIQIESIKNVSTIQRDEMNEVLHSLKKILRHPFFRSVGAFKGMVQENLVLQKANGYSQVYRTWNILRRAYSLNEGIYRLQTKDVATLYEIWCFIEVSHIIKDILYTKENDLSVEHRNRMELSGLFTWELGKGEHSRILFRKDNIELAELIYNPKNTDLENDTISIKDLVVPTCPQKPDIVLRLTKDDLYQNMKLTYLFDAKYRIDRRDSHNVDTPPEDAINQMHRYRDAIYYHDYSACDLKKEVIGGYILFPGDGELDDVLLSRFYKSIQQVNIGAFPLKPQNVENRYLLENFIKKIISKDTKNIISNVIPQKGTKIEIWDRVLIGLVTESTRKGYYNSFIDRTADFYYTGTRFPTSIALHNLRYFIPFIKGNGIRDLYEITKIRTITSSEAKHIYFEDEHTDSIRLCFELKYLSPLFDTYRMIKTNKMINYTFIDTTLIDVNSFLKEFD